MAAHLGNGSINTRLYTTQALAERLAYLDKSRNGNIHTQGGSRAKEIVAIREELLRRNYPLPAEGRPARRIKLAA